MPTTEERVTAAQARVKAASSTQARLAFEHEQAQAAQAAAAEKLRAEFGVSTAEEAQALLAELTADVERELATVETALERTEQ